MPAITASQQMLCPTADPDCGAVEHNDVPVVRPASKDEIEELLRIRAEDKENNTPYQEKIYRKRK